MKGLSVKVYRAAHKYDCTLNGITSQVTDILLIDKDLKGLYEPEKDKVYLTIVRKKHFSDRPEYVFAVPTINGVQQLGGMAGGNFVYSCDSRVRALIPYPISVHDRFEQLFILTYYKH